MSHFDDKLEEALSEADVSRRGFLQRLAGAASAIATGDWNTIISAVAKTPAAVASAIKVRIPCIDYAWHYPLDEMFQQVRAAEITAQRLGVKIDGLYATGYAGEELYASATITPEQLQKLVSLGKVNPTYTAKHIAGSLDFHKWAAENDDAPEYREQSRRKVTELENRLKNLIDFDLDTPSFGPLKISNHFTDDDVSIGPGSFVRNWWEKVGRFIGGAEYPMAINAQAKQIIKQLKLSPPVWDEWSDYGTADVLDIWGEEARAAGWGKKPTFADRHAQEEMKEKFKPHPDDEIYGSSMHQPFESRLMRAIEGVESYGLPWP